MTPQQISSPGSPSGKNAKVSFWLFRSMLFGSEKNKSTTKKVTANNGQIQIEIVDEEMGQVK